MDNLIKFNYSRAVTLKETVAFMVRCLEEANGISLDETYEKAMEYGLINENDEFTRQPDEPILYRDFLTVLTRFLDMPQYLYFEISSGGYQERLAEGFFRKNENKDMTYYEYLKTEVSEKQYDTEY